MWSDHDQQQHNAGGDSKNKATSQGSIALLIAATEMESQNPATTDNSPTCSSSSHAISRKAGRDRSMSVPCHPTQSSMSSEVESVVIKAKRASSYLWMLLHSQNCRLGVDRCTHAGCADAKLIHLHLKTCPVGNEFPCPSRTNGCLQARKLLAHYRRCRSIRARQMGQGASGKGPHVCLICSMVARQARSLLDSNASKSSSSQGVVAHKKGSGNSKCQIFSSLGFKAKIKPSSLSSKPESAAVQRRILSSFSLTQDRIAATSAEDWDMPPPAPRDPSESQSLPASPTDGFLPGVSSYQALEQTTRSKVSSIPMLRKRSESLGSDVLTGGGGHRGVTFAPRPEFLDEHNEDSLVAVELASAELLENGMSTPRRLRSASCHVLSSPTTTSLSADTKCGTIMEEIGLPSHSYMDE